MAHQEKIDYLLINLRELEKLIAGMRDTEIYPASFFSQCFSLSRQLMNELHSLETEQIEELARQMEEHRKLIESIPRRDIAPPTATAEPAFPADEHLAGRPAAQSFSSSAPAVPPTPASAPKTDTPAPAAHRLTGEPLVEAPGCSESATLPPPPPETVPAPPTIPQPLPEIPFPENPATKISPETPEKASSAPGTGLKEISMARTRPVVSPEVTIGEKPTISLNEVLERKNLSDFRKAFSLNDRFRFRRELFGGDEEKMNRVIRELNELATYEDSISYLHHQLQWNVDDAAVADFILLLEKRFS